MDILAAASAILDQQLNPSKHIETVDYCFDLMGAAKHQACALMHGDPDWIAYTGQQLMAEMAVHLMLTDDIN